MTSIREILTLSVFCWQALLAQVPTAIVEIDLENRVNYNGDVADFSRLATDEKVTTAAPPRNFRSVIQLGDIVAVNGRPARGTHVARFQDVNITPMPNPGQAIADTVQSVIVDETFQILQPDGRPIGSIMVVGLRGGEVPPGAPAASLRGDAVIVGGTGAYLGARGQSALGRQLAPPRNASMAEDPASRRRNGGGRARVIMHLISMTGPEVAAVLHADFSPVTTARPAGAGEVLILRASGLGPVRPGVDPGQPFPADPPPVVNSPVEVSVDGQSAEIINAIGWPGRVDTYRVDFRVPAGIAAGAALRLTVAWIAGPSVNIPVQ